MIVRRAKPDKKIRWQAFVYATRFPCEISVDRNSYCNAKAKATAEGKVPLYLDVGAVAELAVVDSDKRPDGCFGPNLREHALILSPEIEATGKRYPNKAAMDAELWDVFSEFCERLAKLARPTP